MLDPPVLGDGAPAGWGRNCTTKTRLLGSDGWDGAMITSYDARDGITFSFALYTEKRYTGTPVHDYDPSV